MRRTLILPAVALAALVGAGLGSATIPPYQGVEAPTPTATAAPFTLPPILANAVECLEDEPCWDCESMGNRICGHLTEDMARTGWKVFDAYGGAPRLLVNPHARVDLTGYSVADPYAAQGPALAADQLALQDSGVWYIFTTTPI